MKIILDMKKTPSPCGDGVENRSIDSIRASAPLLRRFLTAIDLAGFLTYGSLYLPRLPDNISGIVAAFITVHSCGTVEESHLLPF
jgi:hypothetical protein